MARPASEQPTNVELQILGVLWDEGPSPVRTIHRHLSSIKQTNYSTTVKMLSVMLDKGLVRRDESVRPHVYRAAVTRAGAQKRALKDVVQKLYEGSAKSLVMQALSTQKASKEDLAEIRRLIERLEGDQ
ncbi:MAG: BlaI/MecI/CopY family transcriptional regulator [Planctomycetota bacterium]